MKMIPVSSGHISAMGHDGAQEMHIKFKSGETYEYSPISEDEFLEILNAPSIGRKLSQCGIVGSKI